VYLSVTAGAAVKQALALSRRYRHRHSYGIVRLRPRCSASLRRPRGSFDRIRQAMDGATGSAPPEGGNKVVEADETFVGGKD
jgi:hypothetical protein